MNCSELPGGRQQCKASIRGQREWVKCTKRDKVCKFGERVTADRRGRGGLAMLAELRCKILGHG